MTSRTDSSGRAYAGSQRQIQTYVNLHPEELIEAICRALPELRKGDATIEWVSPLKKDDYREYWDEAFLVAVGHPELAGALAEFWPRGGPHWDALVSVGFRERTDHGPRDGLSPASGVLLVEAKSYPKEMNSAGCQAAGASRKVIERAFAEARQWYGVSGGDWLGPLYQFANRLAHVFFFRERAGIPAWLVNVCIVDDPRSPTSRAEWERELASARRSLGFAAEAIPHTAEVFLPGLGKELFENELHG